MDPLKWMGTARCRVQTADKNLTIIHNMTTVHSSVKWIVCVCKKQIHQDFFFIQTLKYESSAEWYMEPSV